MRVFDIETVEGDPELRWGLALWCVDGVGSVRYDELLAHFGSAEGAVRAGPEACAHVLGSPVLAPRLGRDWPDESALGELLGLMQRHHLEVVKREGLPRRLQELGEPPWIFVRGNAAAMDRALAAVVGTRSVRASGIRLTHRIAEWALDRGWGIVSGGALGVDTQAHATAVRRGVPTVVVQPAGLAEPVPRTNRRLFDSVCAGGGCLVSEHPPWRRPTAQLFARRNRLISGLAVITLVVRAPRQSGALITADWAKRQGRAVYAVPGEPGDPTALGCLELLRRGERLLASADDLPWADGREHFGDAPELAAPGGDGATEQPGGPAEWILGELAGGPLTLDEIMSRLRGRVDRAGRVIEMMTRLVLSRDVEPRGPGRYGLRNR